MYRIVWRDKNPLKSGMLSFILPLKKAEYLVRFAQRVYPQRKTFMVPYGWWDPGKIYEVELV